MTHERSIIESTRLAPFRAHRVRWVLVVWTLTIWSSRIRNILVDDALTGFDRAVSLLVAGGLVALAVLVGWSIVRATPWAGVALVLLVAAGVLRWTIRGPMILLSDDWESGFKIVHTILWMVTVVLSALAWHEHRRQAEDQQPQ